MQNLWNIAVYTIREALTKKIFLAFSIISTIELALYFVFMKTARIPPVISPEELERLMINFQWGSANAVLPIGLLLSIFGVSSLTSTFLEKGTAELFLSKPLSRSELLFGRFVGGSIIVFLNIAYLIFGCWVILGALHNYWNPTILIVIPFGLFAFMSLYAIIMFTTVSFRSHITGQLTAIFILLAVSPLLANRTPFLQALNKEWVTALVDGLYYILPKTSELLSKIPLAMVQKTGGFEWQPFVSTALFLGVTLAGSDFLFKKKDY